MRMMSWHLWERVIANLESVVPIQYRGTIAAGGDHEADDEGASLEDC